MPYKVWWLISGLILLHLSPVAAQGDYFVEAEISSTTPFVGEQITYTFRLYTQVSRTNRGLIVDPSFDGFWQQKFDTIQQYNTLINGQAYEVKERRIALFPAYAGDILIEPTTFVIPDDPFQDGEVLVTLPIALSVRPLPEQNGLVGFDGAVGQFEMIPTIDRQTTTLGEPVTLSLTLRGTGNLEQLPAPKLADTEVWRAYANPGSYRYENVDGLLIGEKLFEWLLMPLAPGQHALPSLTITYFDPAELAYRSLNTSGLTVDVLPADELPATFSFPDPGLVVLKPIPSSLARSGSGPGAVFWLGWIMPPLVAAATWLRVSRQRERQRNAALYRYSEAFMRVQKLLADAGQSSDAETAYRMIRTGVTGYFADKLNCDAALLNYQDIEASLLAHSIRGDLQSEILACLELADQGLYAPLQNVEARSLSQRTIKLLGLIDNRWEAQ
jgi:hypothetical protein